MRWRADGTLVCAAMRPEEPGDTYIDDRLHYELSVVQRCVIADVDHQENALWHWVHGDERAFLRALPERRHLGLGDESSEAHRNEGDPRTQE